MQKVILVAISLYIGILFDSTLSQDVPPFTEDCRTDAYPPNEKDRVKTFVLNLDLPPKERWSNLAKEKAPELKAMIQSIIDLVGSVVNVTEAIAFIDKEFALLADQLPAPYGDEMKGIATAADIPLGQVVLYNVFYEIFTLCTSIIAEAPNGTLYHARNLDFGLFLGWDTENDKWALTEKLRPLIINVDYQSGGKTVARAVHFTGYIGVLTGVKPGVLTLSMNERFQLDGGYVGFIKWLLGDHSGKWMGFFLRETLVSSASYEAAKSSIMTEELLAPAYFILGGNSSGQGCVITRSRETMDNLEELKKTESGWFILQTNYDNWKTPPFFDDRRTPATKCMNKMTKEKAGLAGIYNVLSTKPVMNLLTTYTALMQVNSGYLETYIRDCPQPCFPW
ncbi:acid ceramidase-like [Anneissia japonica]|uniref:acid ceramidase-like n=1 Tax=Anneissia japonica TaxID=1529436 RepID=UPI00142594C7|nr:acid ceramidase-like [Anneissia japonica]